MGLILLQLRPIAKLPVTSVVQGRGQFAHLKTERINEVGKGEEQSQQKTGAFCPVALLNVNKNCLQSGGPSLLSETWAHDHTCEPEGRTGSFVEFTLTYDHLIYLSCLQETLICIFKN